jgi:hypothetical protein
MAATGQRPVIDKTKNGAEEGLVPPLPRQPKNRPIAFLRPCAAAEKYAKKEVVLGSFKQKTEKGSALGVGRSSFRHLELRRLFWSSLAARVCFSCICPFFLVLKSWPPRWRVSRQVASVALDLVGHGHSKDGVRLWMQTLDDQIDEKKNTLRPIQFERK